MLTALSEQVLQVCGAESAGVSLLREDVDEFCWPAIAGEWAALEVGAMPRMGSPCGVVIEANRSLLFHDVAQQFPIVAGTSPHPAELLLAPFRVDGKTIGTVWAVMHSEAKRFDEGDRDLLESLADFAGAAYKMTAAVDAASKAREQLRLVNLELGHRLKNLLAVILAISSRTLKSVEPRDDVLAFEQRIMALASAQDLLLREGGGSADLATIAQATAGSLCDAKHLEICGPPLVVGPGAALSLGLIIHELTTNALKYGALTSPDGQVSFTWRVTQEEEPRVLAVWRERGGPTVVPPANKGFGTRLVSLGIIGEGDARVSFDPAGLEVELSAPLRSVTA